MNKIYSTLDFSILQDKQTRHLYTIEFASHTNDNNTQLLLESIIKPKILLGTTITNDYKTIQIKATSIKTLSQYKKLLKKKHQQYNYEIILKMLIDLTRQLEYLIKKKVTFIGYHAENIIIIDDNKFFYLSDEHLYNINKETITITSPFSKDDFVLSPELTKITEIPSKVHYKTSYYSLACLIISNFISEEDESENTLNTLNTTHIKGTKLYYLLERCLVLQPNKRSILFI
jgi:hypothetical protein